MKTGIQRQKNGARIADTLSKTLENYWNFTLKWMHELTIVHTSNSSYSIDCTKSTWMGAHTYHNYSCRSMFIMPSLLRQLIIPCSYTWVCVCLSVDVYIYTLHKTIIDLENWEFGIFELQVVSLSLPLSLPDFSNSSWLPPIVLSIDNYKEWHMRHISTDFHVKRTHFSAHASHTRYTANFQFSRATHELRSQTNHPSISRATFHSAACECMHNVTHALHDALQPKLMQTNAVLVMHCIYSTVMCTYVSIYHRIFVS